MSKLDGLDGEGVAAGIQNQRHESGRDLKKGPPKRFNSVDGFRL
jgi:hypothetical protein